MLGHVALLLSLPTCQAFQSYLGIVLASLHITLHCYDYYIHYRLKSVLTFIKEYYYSVSLIAPCLSLVLQAKCTSILVCLIVMVYILQTRGKDLSDRWQMASFGLTLAAVLFLAINIDYLQMWVLVVRVAAVIIVPFLIFTFGVAIMWIYKATIQLGSTLKLLQGFLLIAITISYASIWLTALLYHEFSMQIVKITWARIITHAVCLSLLGIYHKQLTLSLFLFMGASVIRPISQTCFSPIDQRRAAPIQWQIEFCPICSKKPASVLSTAAGCLHLIGCIDCTVAMSRRGCLVCSICKETAEVRHVRKFLSDKKCLEEEYLRFVGQNEFIIQM